MWLEILKEAGPLFDCTAQLDLSGNHGLLDFFFVIFKESRNRGARRTCAADLEYLGISKILNGRVKKNKMETNNFLIITIVMLTTMRIK